MSGAQVVAGDWLVAVGAGSARPDAAAEEVAVRAPADAEVAGLAARAFVHDGRGRGHGGDVVWSAGRGCPAAGPVAGLAAGVAVELAAAGGREGDRAPRAGDGDHPRIVTPIVTAWARVRRRRPAGAGRTAARRLESGRRGPASRPGSLCVVAGAGSRRSR